MFDRRIPKLVAVLLPLTGFLAVALAAVETIGPGEVAGRSAPAPSCPTFHWTADWSAGGFELAVAEVAAESDGEAAYRRLWSVELPAASTGWTAAGERCLASGRTYVWSIRALAAASDVADGSAPPAWAEARRFEVPAAVSDEEVAAAAALLKRYFEERGEGEFSTAGSSTDSRAPLAPTRWAASAPEAAPAGIAAISGTYPGASGETYGVLGRSDSSSGRGVVGYASSASGSTYGVFGETESALGVGVFGRTAASGGAAVRGESTSTTGTAPGVQGFSSSVVGKGVNGWALATTGETSGVEGRADSTSGKGLYGWAQATSGLNYGAVGRSDSNGGVGVSGWASAATGATIGVLGRSSSTDGAGVQGAAQASSGTTFGVYGWSGSTTAARGVYGLALSTLGQAIGVLGGTNGTSSSAYGVYGIAPGGSAAYAAYFDGGVNVVGNLSKSSGSFKIDHPLDPENKYLYHSFIESPDMMNVYNGNVTLDENGEAWVELPDWFEALNRDFRYQLTPLGDWSACWVAQEVAGNRFLVRGGPRSRISWQVTGIRHDKWAEQHRIPVEQTKSPEEKGKYLHATEWGAAQERGLDWQMREEVRRASAAAALAAEVRGEE